jgi:hypothetical protein
LNAYFWECPPITKNTLDKPFEFVVIKSEALNNINQNSDAFVNQTIDIIYNDKNVGSFLNLKKDATLIIPLKKWDLDLEKFLDYKNISKFTENASEEQQQELWAEVADKLAEELDKNPNNPRWLNTQGLGVHYLHVRIDQRPKYYNCGEYKEWK